MIESNNEKTFIFVIFYTADEKLCECENCFGEKSKNRDKMIQSGTPGQHTKNREYAGKTGAVEMFVMLSMDLIFFAEGSLNMSQAFKTPYLVKHPNTQ